MFLFRDTMYQEYALISVFLKHFRPDFFLNRMIIVQDQERICIKPSFVYYYFYLNRLSKGLHFIIMYHDECVIIPIIYIN